MKCEWQVEIDPYALSVLHKHWPNVPKYRDIRCFLGGKRWRRCRAAWHVDVLAGGFPCQDISFAGTGAGIGGSRSGLWSEFARIIRLLRPRYVLVENVAALLVRGMGRVLQDLAACGLDAEWQSVPAAAVGAPHIRNRIFIVAHAPRVQREEIKRIESNGVLSPLLADAQSIGRQRRAGDAAQVTRRRHTHGSGFRQALSHAHRESLGRIAESRGQRGHWLAEPDVGRVADGIPKRVDRLRGLGNAVVPQVAEFIGRLIAEHAQAEETGPSVPGDAQQT